MARSQIQSHGLEAAVVEENGGSSIASRRRPAADDKDGDACGFRGGILTHAGDAKDEIRLWDDGTFHGDDPGHGVGNRNNHKDYNDNDNNVDNNNDNLSNKNSSNHADHASQRHQPLSVITSRHEDAHLSSLLPSSPLSGNRRRHNRIAPHPFSLQDLHAPPSSSPPAPNTMGTFSTRSRSSRDSSSSTSSCARSPLPRHPSHPPSASTERSLSPFRRPHPPHSHHSHHSHSPPWSTPFRRQFRDATAASSFPFPLPRWYFSNKRQWCLAWLCVMAVHAWGWHRPWGGRMDWPMETAEVPREEPRTSSGTDQRRSHRERDGGTSQLHRSHHGDDRGVRRDERTEGGKAVSGNGTNIVANDWQTRQTDVGDEGTGPWRERHGKSFDGVYSTQRNTISEWSLESFWRTSDASKNETVTFHIHGASKFVPRSISFRGTQNDDSGVPASKLFEWISSRQGSAEEPSEDEADLKSSTVVWDKDRDCVPMADWQDTFHPTCNSIHEMDVSLMLSERSFSLVSSKGFWRNAWKVNVTRTEDYPMTPSTSSVGDRYAVLKSLKYVHDPNDETFELSRVDAVALDVVTQSRFTIRIYGYCGTSSLQEFANGDLKGLLPKLEPLEKLRYAAWVAQGVADVHGVGAEQETEPHREWVVPFIHNDLNMDNILLGRRDGDEVPLLNDFNIAVFRKKDAETGEPCKFRGRFANPQWMSPEQQERPEDELSTKYLNEKVDIYALGNILYKIAVGNSPWKNDYKTDKITPELKAKIARAKLRGGKPKVPAEVRNTTDPSLLAILNAMDWCYRNDPELRPSAREIAYNLKAELEALERNGTANVQWPRLRSRRLI